MSLISGLKSDEIIDDTQASQDNFDVEQGLTLELKRELLDVKLLQMLVTNDSKKIVNIYLSNIKE